MSQSLSQLYIHLVFSTKNRSPFLKNEIRENLHAYLAGILKNTDNPALIMNSVPDHIHILFRLSKNYSLAQVVEQVKKQSSKWMKTQLPILKDFSWQNGYAAFSVSSSKLKAVENYIKLQEEHHKKISFKEEVETFMKEYNIIEYDAEYFWK